MQGVLLKKGGLANVEWQERYFCLTGPKALSYYLTKQHVNPQGTISLEEAIIINTTKNNTPPFSFELKAGKRKYLLRANTLEDLNYWCDGLDNVIQGKAPAEPIVAPDSQNALDKIREDILEKLNGFNGEIYLERFHVINVASTNNPGGQTPATRKVLQKKLSLPVSRQDVATVELDETKFTEANFLRAVKIRATLSISNEEIVKQLDTEFRELGPNCTESRAVQRIPFPPGVINNLLYDKSKCTKSDWRRKVNELVNGTIVIPIKLTLNHESLSNTLKELDKLTPASSNAASVSEQQPESEVPKELEVSAPPESSAFEEPLPSYSELEPLPPAYDGPFPKPVEPAGFPVPTEPPPPEPVRAVPQEPAPIIPASNAPVASPSPVVNAPQIQPLDKEYLKFWLPPVDQGYLKFWLPNGESAKPAIPSAVPASVVEVVADRAIQPDVLVQAENIAVPLPEPIQPANQEYLNLWLSDKKSVDAPPSNAPVASPVVSAPQIQPLDSEYLKFWLPPVDKEYLKFWIPHAANNNKFAQVVDKEYLKFWISETKSFDEVYLKFWV